MGENQGDEMGCVLLKRLGELEKSSPREVVVRWFVRVSPLIRPSGTFSLGGRRKSAAGAAAQAARGRAPAL